MRLPASGSSSGWTERRRMRPGRRAELEGRCRRSGGCGAAAEVSAAGEACAAGGRRARTGEDKAAQKSRLERRRPPGRTDRLIEPVSGLQPRIAARSAPPTGGRFESAAASAASSLGDQIDGLCKVWRTPRTTESARRRTSRTGAGGQRQPHKMLKDGSRQKATLRASVPSVAAKSGHLPDSWRRWPTSCGFRPLRAGCERFGSALQDIVAPGSKKRAWPSSISEGSLRARRSLMDRLRRMFTKERCRGARDSGPAYDLVGSIIWAAARCCLACSDCRRPRRRGGGAQAEWLGKIVTLDGELLVPSGAITGGSRLRKGAGLIERKRDIADLTAGLINSPGSRNRGGGGSADQGRGRAVVQKPKSLRQAED